MDKPTRSEIEHLKLGDREALKNELQKLEEATGHRYSYIKLGNKPVAHTKFYLRSGFYDTKWGISEWLGNLEYNKKYLIEDLLNG